MALPLGLCTLCGRAHPDHLCETCLGLLTPLGNHCPRCAEPLAQSGAPCGQCQRRPGHIAKTVCPYRYAFPVNRLITLFKHHGHQPSLAALLQGSAREISADYGQQPFPELLVPVPLHWWRRWCRGFNQAQLLAQHWGRELELPTANLLQRSRPTPSQQTLARRERLRNLEGAFRLKGRTSHHLADKCIALVDDVVTTGATGETLARLLLQAGAREVHLWALARTPLRRP